MSYRLFIDINYAFIRQPIKLAILNSGIADIDFVDKEEDADLILGSSDKIYTKPVLYLTDNADLLVSQENSVDISVIPTSTYEMTTLIHKLQRIIDGSTR
ncbi:MAG: hypothetical protein JHC33_14445 [Ignisphaera sp.]|jgi:hypothetical protein|nr:hypothetical protein [Ignisphaera sp.]